MEIDTEEYIFDLAFSAVALELWRNVNLALYLQKDTKCFI